ncbi:MAG TPA: metal ABC transporter ATP-binding protein [Roseiflexaceae bacterium]|nr:metal ABC transporter ATP-binding protein [Roseiflexaceae bacterium]
MSNVATAPALLDLSHVTAQYRGQPALEDVSFQVFTGEQLALVGPNGAGKSTLFKVIVGVLPLASGAIRAPGHATLRELGVAYVPQRSQVDWTFPVTVSDVVMMGRVGKIGLFRRPKAADRERVRWCLELVGMGGRAHRQIGELSGGQQQRVFIARALAQEAALLLMDEPLTGLDLPSQEEIFGILDTLREQRVTVIVATHDLDQAADRFDRVLLLNRRMIGIGRPNEVFTTARLAEAYGGHMRLVPTENGMLIIGDTCCTGASSDEPRA